MPKYPNAELLELFSQEVESYIPGIRQNLQTLSLDPASQDAGQELHRFFHNIKGAASQVQQLDLSQGAKIIELALEDLLEVEQPVSERFLAALQQATDLLAKYCSQQEYDPEVDQGFHAQITSLFLAEQESAEELSGYLQEVRSIFPLLQELAGCLSADGGEGGRRDQLVYGKLAHAVSILSATVLAAGMERQSELMEDFHLLLRKLHESAIPHHGEISGLMQDFLSFLEAAFTHENPENDKTIGRVKDQLQRFRTVLTALGRQPSEVPVDVEVEDFQSLDIFNEPMEDDQVGAFFDDVLVANVLEEDIEEGEIAAVETAAIEPEAIALEATETEEIQPEAIEPEVIEAEATSGESERIDDTEQVENAEIIETEEGLELAETADTEEIVEAEELQASEEAETAETTEVAEAADAVEEPEATVSEEPVAEMMQEAAVEPSSQIAEVTATEDEPLDEDQLLLMEIFREECDEHLIVINQSLNMLESQVREPHDLTPELMASISEMRRAVHTLKGAASMTGVNLLARGAHSLEDLLDWLHDEAKEISPREVRVIATGIDVIEFLSQSPQAKESAKLDELVATIGEYLEAKTGPEVSLEEAIEEMVEEPEEEAAASQTLPVDTPVAAEQAAMGTSQVALPGDIGTLRVRLEELDELVSIEGELVVSRGAMEKMVDEFSRTLFELETVKENLRRKSQELESGFEVQSLYGFNPVAAKGGSANLPDSDLTEFDPIELDRYSQLNLIIRSLNEISVDVNSIHNTLSSLAGDLGGQVGKQQLTMRLMQEKLMRIRMTPLSSISRVLFRTVRDTAAKLGKKVTLNVIGEDVYMDRFVWARVTDPLMHILRNGVDHGIETAEVRAAAGKPEAGTISFKAEQRSRYVVLRIADDGGGIDFSLIREKIKRENLATNPESLSEKELIEYLFHPSFSTRQDITTISGRGVGLDVVRRNIQDLRGSIQINNRPGQGVEFEIHIPFTLSVNRAALVSIAGKEFAIPLQDIMQVRHFSPKEIDEGNGLSIRLEDQSIPVSNLGFHLQLEQKMESLAPDSDGILAILFMKDGEKYAVAIEAVTEQREIIVKNLGSHLIHVRGISGVTLTGSGGLIPILNLRELIDKETVDQSITGEPQLQMELNEPLKVLIVDDSISVRHSVARLVESQSWKQQQAVDGLDALAKLETFTPDVIILDIEMPRMNGYEFKSSINNLQAYKDIPVVMLTSRASEKHQQKARELGIEHYLTKPYQDEDFVRLLETIQSRS